MVEMYHRVDRELVNYCMARQYLYRRVGNFHFDLCNAQQADIAVRLIYYNWEGKERVVTYHFKRR